MTTRRGACGRRRAPHVFDELASEAGMRVHVGARIASVKRNGAGIVKFAPEDVMVFRAKMFIDATYEGELMAKAGRHLHPAPRKQREAR
jgi:flavin-dependent dehydrogenase